MRFFGTHTVLCGLVLVFLSNYAFGSTDWPLTVSNEHGGSWTGVSEDEIVAYYGIRFATNERFKAPQRWVERNHSKNDEWAPKCAQSRGSGSEDCLFLNVFRPKSSSSKPLPVAVHIHGGSFTRGGSNDEQFPHTSFAQNGIVTVTIAYRLGLFGFMSISDFAAESPEAPANFGLLDQRLALEWVRDHVALFGGNPDEVTVLGESAGAASILHQMTYRNGSQPSLFKRALLISPPALSGPEYTLERSWVGYNVAARSWGCEPGQGESTLQCVRAVPHGDLDYARSRLMVFPFVTSTPSDYMCNGWPINDGVNFPDVGVALAEGRFNKDVEVIIGSDFDEGSVFVPLMAPIVKPSDSFLLEQLNLVYGHQNAARIWEVYKPGSHPRRLTSADSFGTITGDTILNCITWTHTHLLTKHVTRPLRRYGGEWVYNHALLTSLGSFHTSSLVLLYNNINAGKPYPAEFTPDEAIAAEYLFAKVIDFVSGKGLDDASWPIFTLDTQASLVWTKNESTGNLSIITTQEWKSQDCSVWPELYPPHGLWAPPCYADIWAHEPLLAATLNGAMWWVFLNLKAAGVLFGLITLFIFGCIIKCCCSCCCSTRKSTSTSAKKLKRD